MKNSSLFMGARYFLPRFLTELPPQAPQQAKQMIKAI
jgi:hypothetical protein